MKPMVLVVDDNASVLRAVAQMVEALGYPTLRAGSGQEALQTYAEHRARIHCVLLDLTMPGMDGIETMTALRAIDDGVGIVLSSGYCEDSVQKRMKVSGPTRFLQKPFTEEDLKVALTAVMGFVVGRVS